jgi:hypothetical protein
MALDKNAQGKITFMALAMAFFYLGYDAFAASGWQINESFWVGVVLVAIGAGILIFREYWKMKYGQDLAVDMEEIREARDGLMELGREQRDLIVAHSNEQMAAADAMIAIAEAAGVDEEKIANMKNARNKWKELLDAI